MKDELKILRLKGINGLYDELYKPNPYCLDEISINIHDGILDMGQFFWAEILSDKSVINLLNIVKHNINDNNLSPQILSAIADENLFLHNVKMAKVFLCDQGRTPQEFFSYVETLSILCSMYNQFVYGDKELTVNNGFFIDETSSKDLYLNCCNPTENPMANWIIDNIIPVILNYEPDIIFCDGRPTISFFTVAKILKDKKIPCHISSSRNSSEYYSLSKIRKYLVKNKYLFLAFDSIILDDFNNIEHQLIQSIAIHTSLDNVKNLIFNSNKGIQCTVGNIDNTKKSSRIEIQSRLGISRDEFIISPHYIEDVHIMPAAKCYWNKCVFCGINKKYLFDDIDNDNVFLENLATLKNNIETNNIKYIWFIDEAIPPARLRMIAEYFLKEDIHVFWQARCRIEECLIDNDLPELLSRSGLRELRLGLESASLKVLKLMNKFPDGFSLKIVTKIVNEYHSHGISIHFPMIIGFPGETKEDRRLTYDYLSFLKTKYPSFTFNINILSMDVSSKLFEDWSQYNIKKIELPCNPDEFLGNITNYDEKQYAILDAERDSFMQDNLYPWYPADAYTKPHIFYRLCETIRNTLIWKSLPGYESEDIYDLTSSYLKLCKNVSYYNLTDDAILIYNWNTHRYLKSTQKFMELLNTCKEPQNFTSLIKSAKDIIPGYDCILIIKRLIKYGFLLPSNEVNEKQYDNKIAHYFDEMYATQTYDYVISKNIWIQNNIHLIPKGKILDIGIGSGQNVEFLLNHGYSVCGIDLSASAIEQLQKKYVQEKCEFLCADITQFEIGINKYNFIICSMILHYLDKEELKHTIKKIKQALNDNGYLYISVLSINDALYKDNSTSLVKHFFSFDEIVMLFDDMQIIEISDNLYKDYTRHLNTQYWGIIECVLKKGGERNVEKS